MSAFLQIPQDLRTPGVFSEIDSSRAVRGLVGQRQKLIAIGVKLAGGATAATPYLVTSSDQAEALFGRGSQLAEMCRAVLKANRNVELHAVGLAEPTDGTKAAGKLTFTGPATATGELALYVAGVRVAVTVVKGMTAAEVAQAVVAAITDLKTLPVTAAVDSEATSEVIVTARWKGASGNEIDLRVNHYQGEALPAGVGVTITAMATGVADYDITGALAALGEEAFQTFVNAFSDTTNLGVLEAELADRYGPMRQIQAHAFMVKSGTLSAMTTLSSARNSKHVTLMGGGKSPTAPWIFASVVAAVAVSEPDPARPRQTMALPGIVAPKVPDRLTREERNTALYSGLATYTVDDAGTVRIERLVTTYRTSDAGAPDTAFLDYETLVTLAALRFTMRTRIQLKYPRHKLAKDGTRIAPGQAIVTPKTMKAELLGLFLDWERAGWVEDFEQFKSELICEIDDSDPNRMNVFLGPNLINQFRVFAAQLQFVL